MKLVGIDVGKNSHHFCVMDKETGEFNVTFLKENEKIINLLATLQRHQLKCCDRHSQYHQPFLQYSHC